VASTLTTALARLRNEERTRHEALHDPLTGLANRTLLRDRLQHALARRDRGATAALFVDLDNFKQVNDTLGHTAGDKLLKDTAAVWSSQLRAHDLLARYGGEEFALQFIAWPEEAAVRLVDRLRGAVPGPQTCSAGLAQWNGQEAAEELFARADLALLEAKHGGRDRTVTAAGPDAVFNGGEAHEGPEPPPERRRGPPERRARSEQEPGDEKK
jgi:diguanylate cyclase (GGDEF)-like protein